jgi:hypothetical protein
VFTPVLAKHTKHFSLIDAVSLGVDRMQRNFKPMQDQILQWKPNGARAVLMRVASGSTSN